MRAVQRVEGEEDDVGAARLLDLLRQRVADLVRGDEHALRRRVRGGPQGSRHRHVEALRAIVEPGAVGLLAGKRPGHERTPGEIDVEFGGVVGAGDEQPPVVRHQHPRRTQQVSVLLGLIEHVAARSLQQALAELRHLHAHAAHTGQRRGPTGEEGLHAAAPPHQRAPDRLVHGAMCLERRETKRQAQHHYDEQRRGEEDPGGEAAPPPRPGLPPRARRQHHPPHSAFPLACPAAQLSAVLPQPPGARCREGGLPGPGSRVSQRF